MVDYGQGQVPLLELRRQTGTTTGYGRARRRPACADIATVGDFVNSIDTVLGSVSWPPRPPVQNGLPWGSRTVRPLGSSNGVRSVPGFAANSVVRSCK